jgi:hypothetical protein
VWLHSTHVMLPVPLQQLQVAGLEPTSMGPTYKHMTRALFAMLKWDGCGCKLRRTWQVQTQAQIASNGSKGAAFRPSPCRAPCIPGR